MAQPEKSKGVQPGTELSSLLETVVEQSRHRPAVPVSAQGIAVGQLAGFDPQGRPLVDIPVLALTARPAATLVQLDEQQVGQMLALGFEGNDPGRPIVLGPLMSKPAEPASLDALIDGQRVTLQGEREIELRCGEAAIILSADGRIILRGTYITSHASATQRILGGSVNVN